jgi:hypothetical protein
MSPKKFMSFDLCIVVSVSPALSPSTCFGSRLRTQPPSDEAHTPGPGNRYEGPKAQKAVGLEIQKGCQVVQHLCNGPVNHLSAPFSIDWLLNSFISPFHWVHQKANITRHLPSEVCAREIALTGGGCCDWTTRVSYPITFERDSKG